MRLILLMTLCLLVACGGEEENMLGQAPMVSIENNGPKPCFPELTAVTTTDGPDNPITSIAWTGPDDFNASEVTIAAEKAGTYTVVVTDQNNQTGTASLDISLEDVTPTPPMVSIEDEGLDSDFNLVLSLVVQGNSDITDISWSTAETSSKILVENPGTYSVTITDECGAMATAMREVTPLDLSPYEGKWSAQSLDVKVITIVGSNSNEITIKGVTFDYTVTLASPNWMTEGEYSYELTQGNSSTITEVSNIMGNGTYNIEDDLFTSNSSFFTFDNMMTSMNGPQTSDISINEDGQMVISNEQKEESTSNGEDVVIVISATSVWNRL